MKTLCDLFAEHAQRHPEAVAVYDNGTETTYGELDRQADSVAARLAKEGVVRGDRVAMLLGNSSAYIACYLGIQRAGCVAVALNPDTTPSELKFTLGSALPAVLVVGQKLTRALVETPIGEYGIRLVLRDGEKNTINTDASWKDTGITVESLSGILRQQVAANSVHTKLNDAAQIIYTSGTTGRAKGVTLSHRNIAANCRSIIDVLGLTPADSVFVTLPFFYSYGNSLLFTHLAIGGRLVLAHDFVFWNRALDLLESEQATGFAGVPSSFAMLVHKSDFLQRNFTHLRYLTCAGGALAPAIVHQIREALPEVRLFPMYGQTEATARLSILSPEEWERKPGSIGRGIPGVELQIVNDEGQPIAAGEEGEIVARGENIMLGYWNDAEETARTLRPEGLRTGDLARVDTEGYITIVGRKSDIIKSGAYRLHPAEIEAVLAAHPLVAEAAVVGLADEIWGERPVAFVVRTQANKTPGAVEIQAEDIIEFCRGRLPRHKTLREVRFVERLPRTSSGKIRRDELRRIAHT